MSINCDVDRCAVTPQKDRTPLYAFTFADDRRSLAGRIGSHQASKLARKSTFPNSFGMNTF